MLNISKFGLVYELNICRINYYLYHHVLGHFEDFRAFLIENIYRCSHIFIILQGNYILPNFPYEWFEIAILCTTFNYWSQHFPNLQMK